MKITINQFKIALLTNLLVIGLAGCASTPAPWSRPDTSPWQGKNSASSSTTPADQEVSPAPEQSTAEPLPSEDNTMPSSSSETSLAPAEVPPPRPEAQPAPEPAPMSPPPAAPMAKPAATAVSNEQRVMAMSGSYYAVQVYAASTLASVQKYKTRHHLDNMMAVKTARGSKTYYVLLETFPNRSAANAAAAEVKKETGTTPWVRSVAGLKKVVEQ